VQGTVRRVSATLIVIVAAFGLLAASTAIAAPTASSAARAFGASILKMGSRGSAVRTLQQGLTTLGFPADADGQFGRGTKKRLKQWEKTNLATQGVVRNGKLSVAEAKLFGAQVTAKKAAAPDSGARTQPQPLAESGTGQQFTFPIRGAHDFGTAINRFGADRGGRSHKGQDTFATCGTPLVAVEGGTVVYAGYQGDAGNYIVIKGSGTKRDYVYMHLQQSALFDTDDTVAPAAPIGKVGETGNAVGCHLHFELWTPPGWYDGGEAVDPLPFLEEWDKTS
jgi:murein DD-endopeptidase MepM/ murein hydrolase activator NlpD